MYKYSVDPNSQKSTCLAVYKTFISIFVPSVDQDKSMLQSPWISYFKIKWNQQLYFVWRWSYKNYRGKIQYLELALDLAHRSTEILERGFWTLTKAMCLFREERLRIWWETWNSHELLFYKGITFPYKISCQPDFWSSAIIQEYYLESVIHFGLYKNRLF